MIDRIYLLTDFGYSDYYIASMKNEILKINQSIKHIIDITHNVSPWNIREGSFILWQFVRTGVSRAVIVGVIDPGVGSTRRDIVIECYNDLYLVGPDNGLFYPAIMEIGFKNVYLIDINDRVHFPFISNTFYGRDVYAKSAAYISKGDRSFLTSISPDSLVKNNIFDIKIGDRFIEGEVLHTDRFGNIVTNIRCKSLEIFSNLLLETKNKKFKIRIVNTFSNLRKGEIGLICGSSELYEIVSYLYNAAKKLGISPGDKIKIVLI